MMSIEQVYLQGLEELMRFAAKGAGVPYTSDYLEERSDNIVENFETIDLVLCGYCVGAGYTFEDYEMIDSPFDSMYNSLIELAKEG